MIPVFFYVAQHRDSQIAYKILMTTKMQFKPFEIRGKNVSNILKKYGIDKVPTLYLPNKKGKIEGSENIAKYIGYTPSLPLLTNVSTKKEKKPKIQEKYKKALKDEYYEEEGSFEEKFKAAQKEDESSEVVDSRNSLQRSLEDNPIQSEEQEEIISSSNEEESDEISLEV